MSMHIKVSTAKMYFICYITLCGRPESVDSVPSTSSGHSSLEEDLRPELMASLSIVECYCGHNTCPHCNLPYL